MHDVKDTHGFHRCIYLKNLILKYEGCLEKKKKNSLKSVVHGIISISRYTDKTNK